MPSVCRRIACDTDCFYVISLHILNPDSNLIGAKYILALIYKRDFQPAPFILPCHLILRKGALWQMLIGKPLLLHQKNFPAQITAAKTIHFFILLHSSCLLHSGKFFAPLEQGCLPTKKCPAILSD